MALNKDVKRALDLIKFPGYHGPLLGDLIDQAIVTDPMSVLSGAADPSAGAGVEANPGDLYRRDAAGAGGGELWVKVGDADTGWSLVNTGAGGGDNLGDHTATQDLQMSGFTITTDVTDGAAAVGNILDTDNLLSTDGSKILSVRTAGNEYMALRRGDDLYGDLDVSVFELLGTDGGIGLQIGLDTPNDYTVIQARAGHIIGFEASSDWSLGAGFTSSYLEVDPAFGVSFGTSEDGGNYVFTEMTSGQIEVATGGLGYPQKRLIFSLGGNLEVPTTMSIGGTQVISSQQAAIADATDAPSAISQLNLLLAACRAHGLIAT